MNRKKLKILPNLAKMVFQRVVMVGISILAQIAVFVLMIWYCKDQNDWFYWGLMMLSIGATLFIISKNTNPAYKIAWLVPILLFPVFGGLFYLLLGGNRLSRRQPEKDELRRAEPAQAPAAKSGDRGKTEAAKPKCGSAVCVYPKGSRMSHLR